MQVLGTVTLEQDHVAISLHVHPHTYDQFAQAADRAGISVLLWIAFAAHVSLFQLEGRQLLRAGKAGEGARRMQGAADLLTRLDGYQPPAGHPSEVREASSSHCDRSVSSATATH